MVVGMSDGASHTEFYCVQGSTLRQLKKHDNGIGELDLARSKYLYVRTDDGMTLDAMIFAPRARTGQPWPTVVCAHGGPDDRIIETFDVLNYNMVS